MHQLKPAQSIKLAILYTDGEKVKELHTEIVGDCIWFSLADLCAVLGAKVSRDLMGKLSEDEAEILTVIRYGQYRDTLFVNESGLCNVLFQQRTERAENVRKWIFYKILPEIRGNGSFYKSAAESAQRVNELETRSRFLIQDGVKWLRAGDIKKAMHFNKTTLFFRCRSLGLIGKAKKIDCGTKSIWYVREDAISEFSKMTKAMKRERGNAFMLS